MKTKLPLVAFVLGPYRSNGAEIIGLSSGFLKDEIAVCSSGRRRRDGRLYDQLRTYCFTLETNVIVRIVAIRTDLKDITTNVACPTIVVIGIITNSICFACDLIYTLRYLIETLYDLIDPLHDLIHDLGITRSRAVLLIKNSTRHPIDSRYDAVVQYLHRRNAQIKYAINDTLPDVDEKRVHARSQLGSSLL